jgi:lactobin A/cerein 7B family class IIb bacteriocin
MTSEMLGTQRAPMFEKRTAAELTEQELLEVDGGTLNFCIWAAYVGIITSTISIYQAGVATGQYIYSITH